MNYPCSVKYSLTEFGALRASCKSQFTSCRRKPESRLFKHFWTPAFAWVTELRSSARASSFMRMFRENYPTGIELRQPIRMITSLVV